MFHCCSLLFRLYLLFTLQLLSRFHCYLFTLHLLFRLFLLSRLNLLSELPIHFCSCCPIRICCLPCCIFCPCCNAAYVVQAVLLFIVHSVFTVQATFAVHFVLAVQPALLFKWKVFCPGYMVAHTAFAVHATVHLLSRLHSRSHCICCLCYMAVNFAFTVQAAFDVPTVYRLHWFSLCICCLGCIYCPGCICCSFWIF